MAKKSKRMRQDSGPSRIVRLESLLLEDFVPMTIIDLSRQHQVANLEEAMQITITLLHQATQISQQMRLPGWAKAFRESSNILADKILRPLQDGHAILDDDTD